jgi:hypothetical protein
MLHVIMSEKAREDPGLMHSKNTITLSFDDKLL